MAATHRPAASCCCELPELRSEPRLLSSLDKARRGPSASACRVESNTEAQAQSVKTDGYHAPRSACGGVVQYMLSPDRGRTKGRTGEGVGRWETGTEVLTVSQKKAELMIRLSDRGASALRAGGGQRSATAIVTVSQISTVPRARSGHQQQRLGMAISLMKISVARWQPSAINNSTRLFSARARPRGLVSTDLRRTIRAIPFVHTQRASLFHRQPSASQSTLR